MSEVSHSSEQERKMNKFFMLVLVFVLVLSTFSSAFAQTEPPVIPVAPEIECSTRAFWPGQDTPDRLSQFAVIYDYWYGYLWETVRMDDPSSMGEFVSSVLLYSVKIDVTVRSLNGDSQVVLSLEDVQPYKAENFLILQGSDFQKISLSAQDFSFKGWPNAQISVVPDTGAVFQVYLMQVTACYETIGEFIWRRYIPSVIKNN